jgi:hypothetical protein
MKEIGVDIIVSGIESGLDDELQAYCSKTDATSNSRVLDKIDSMEIFFTLLGHMMFSPFLCLDDLYSKAEFLRNIHRGWDYLNVSNNVLVYRGTALHAKIVESRLAEPFPPLSILVPYSFLDERVKKVASAVGAIKSYYPVMELNNLVYDALNISSRALNPMNAEIVKNPDLLRVFRNELENILSKLETAYISCLVNLCDLAAGKWSENGVRDAMERNLGALFPEQHQRLQGIIDSLLHALERRGVETDRLVLKTWLSAVNQRNTSGGNV